MNSIASLINNIEKIYGSVISKTINKYIKTTIDIEKCNLAIILCYLIVFFFTFIVYNIHSQAWH